MNLLPRALRPVGDPIPVPVLRLLSASGRAPDGDAAAPPRLRSIGFGAAADGWKAEWLDSATSALAVALLAAIEQCGCEDPEVAIPAYACSDVATAVLAAGATPVLVDTVPHGPWMDPVRLREVLGPRMVAVIHLRFLGLPGNGGDLRAIIGDHGPLLIEDAAHCLPDDAVLATPSDAIVFSFGKGKPLSIRHGGLLLRRRSVFQTENPEKPEANTVPVADTLAASASSRGARLPWRHLLQAAAYDIAIDPSVYWILTRVLGVRTDRATWQQPRTPGPFDPRHTDWLIEAARVARRRESAGERSGRVWRLHQAMRRVSGPWIDLPARLRPTWMWRYPILIDDTARRDDLFRTLHQAGLGASRLYGDTLQRVPALAQRVRASHTPMAEDFAARLLTLPVHEHVTPGDFDRMESILRRFATSARARPAGLQPQPAT